MEAGRHGLHHNPILEQTPDQIPDRGHEQQEPERISDKSGGQQQNARNQYHNAMNEVSARNPVGAHFRIDPVEKPDALPPEQKAPDDGGEKDHAQCCPHANLTAYHHKSGDFSQWNGEQQKRDNGKTHDVMSAIGLPVYTSSLK